ncbi:MAG: hypothetical protein JW904_01985 [Spirochaetales bacterium]|nr:hypothetical protein [Spirochaetales bacterium]
MKTTIIFLCIALGLSLVFSYVFSEETAGWTKVSPLTLPEERAKEFSMIPMGYVQDGLVIGYIDTSGNPFVMAYSVFTKRWDYMGENIITDAKVSDIYVAYDFELDGPDTCFIAFEDSAQKGKATVMACDDKEKRWKVFGEAGFTPDKMEDFVFIDTSGGFRCAFLDSSRKPRLLQISSDDTWFELRDGEKDTISEDRASQLALCESDRHGPIVAFADRKQSDKVTVMEFKGSWQPLGNKGFSDGRINNLKIAGQYSRQSKRDRVFAAYSDWAHDKKLTVMYNENSSAQWLPLGGKGFTEGVPESLDIAVYKMVPFVAFADKAHDGAATVMYYFKDAWRAAGKPGFSETGVTDIEIKFDGDTAYVGYITTDRTKHIEVWRMDVEEFFK